MKPPAFQFYADDFIGGTITMTNEERGLYILLLCLQWTQGSVSEEDVQRLGLGLANGSLLRVRSKFVPDEADGSLKNARLESERVKQAEYRAKQAENGKLGGRPKTQAYPKPNPTANPNESSPSPSPSPSPSSVSDSISKERRFAPPTLEAVKLQAAKIGLPELEADAFLNYYEANGWRVGRNAMKSWTAALNNWKLNYDKRTYSSRGAGYGKPTPADIRNSRIIGADEVRERERRAAADDAAGLTKMPYEPDYVSPRAQRLAAEAADKARRESSSQG